jgi:hypothetical protein
VQNNSLLFAVVLINLKECVNEIGRYLIRGNVTSAQVKRFTV